MRDECLQITARFCLCGLAKVCHAERKPERLKLLYVLKKQEKTNLWTLSVTEVVTAAEQGRTAGRCEIQSVWGGNCFFRSQNIRMQGSLWICRLMNQTSCYVWATRATKGCHSPKTSGTGREGPAWKERFWPVTNDPIWHPQYSACLLGREPASLQGSLFNI